jgi:hypothetical protein
MAIKFQNSNNGSVKGVKFQNSKNYLEDIKTPVVSPTIKPSTSSFADFRMAEEEETKKQPLPKVDIKPSFQKKTTVFDVVKNIPSAIVSGMSDVNTGLLKTLSTLTEIPTALEEKITNKKLSDSELTKFLKNEIAKQEKAAEPYKQNVQDVSGPGKYLLGAVQSIPQVLPALTGATSAKALGAIGTTAFGSGARQAEQQGADIGKQVLSGIGSAGVELATEALPIKNLTDLVGGKGSIATVAKNAVQEFLGEATAEALSPLITGITQGDKYTAEQYTKNLKETATNALNAGITGALAGLLTTGAALGINTAQVAKKPTQENVAEVVAKIEKVTPISPIIKEDLLSFFKEQANIPTQTENFTPEYNPYVDYINRIKEEQAAQPSKFSDYASKNNEATPSEEISMPIKETDALKQPTTDLNSMPEQVYQETSKESVSSYNEPTSGNAPIEQLLSTDFDINSLNDTQSIESALEKARKIQIENPDLYIKMNLQLFSEKAQQKLLKLSNSASTLQKAGFATPESIQATQALQDKGFFDTERITNKATVKEAQQEVEANEQSEINRILQLEAFKGAKDVAIAQDLMRKAVNRNDIDAYNKLSVKYAILGTKAGQEVQAMSMLKKLTPEGMLSYAQKVLAKESTKATETTTKLENVINQNLTEAQKADLIKKILNSDLNTKKKMSKKKFIDQLVNGTKEGAMTAEQIQKLVAEIYDIKTLTTEDSSRIVQFMRNAESLTGRDKDVEIARALKVISNNMPQSASDQFSTLQRISMLMNLRTQSRNTLGNIGMTVMEIGKEVPRIAIDALTSKIRGSERTANTYKLKDFKAARKGANIGLYEAYDDYIKGVNTRRDSGQFEINRGKSFKDNTGIKPLDAIAKGLNKANELTSFMLSAGDRPFTEFHYELEKSRLSRLDKYKNNPEQLEIDALAAAEERTFQNSSALAASVTEARNALGIPGKIVLPYSYTPANIVDKIFDYTPLGITRTISKNLIYDNFSNNGVFNQKEFTERAARNITGTALISLGYALAQAGIATGAYDEDKDIKAFQQAIGMQDYAFKFGDKEYTFDWAQPVSVPLAIGVNMFNSGLTENEMKQTVYDRAMQAIVQSGNIIFEQPLLTGLQKVFGGYGADSIAENIKGLALDAPLQIVPGLSLMRQLRQVTDSSQRQIDYNDPLQQLQNQLPIASQLLPEKISPLGEAVEYEGNIFQRAFNAFLSPGQLGNSKLSEIEALYMKNYAELKDKTIFPRVPPVSYKLTPLQKSQWNEDSGGYISETVSKALDDGTIKNINGKELAELLKYITDNGYDYAKEQYQLRLKD